MIVQSFRSVLWVGAVAGAALSCYMVSLRVASERASLERVESRILMAKRDIRSLDTELTTRGRIRQLERWNSDVLALGAPVEAQFLENEVQLASLTRVDPVEPSPSVMLASIMEVSEPRAMLATYRPDDTKLPARIVRASMPKVKSPNAIVGKPKLAKVALAEAKPAPKSTVLATSKIAARVPKKAKSAPPSERLASASKSKPAASRALAAASKPIVAKRDIVRVAAAKTKTPAKLKIVHGTKVAALAREGVRPAPRRERLVDASKLMPARLKTPAAARSKPARVADAKTKSAPKPKTVLKIKVAALASEKAEPGKLR